MRKKLWGRKSKCVALPLHAAREARSLALWLTIVNPPRPCRSHREQLPNSERRDGDHLVRDLPALPCDNAWLDGELVHLDPHGFPDFEALHESVNGGAHSRLFYQVWDAAWLDGRRHARQPLLDRKHISRSC